MAFEELYLVSTRIAPLDGAAVDDLLTECGLDQPGGYREFMTRFGLGEVCSFLRVRSPDEIREWRREEGSRLLDEGLWEVEAEDWMPWGVSFEQYCGGIALWSTNQRPSYYALPGHGPRVFQVEPGEVVCYERGMPDMIPAVAQLMFEMNFPYFEPRRRAERAICLTRVRGWNLSRLLRPSVSGGGRVCGVSTRSKMITS